MLSTVNTATLTTVTGRRGEMKTKPLVIHKYNQSMGGVDKADQHAVCYSFGRRSVKWWRKLMFWLFEVGIVNSYIMYKMSVNKPLTHVDYRRQLVVSPCDGLVVGVVRRQLMRPTRPDERFQGRHYVERGTKRRRCLECNDHKKDKDMTQYITVGHAQITHHYM